MQKTPLILFISFFISSLLWIGSAQAQKIESASTFPQGNFSALKNMGVATVLQVISPQTLKLSNGDIIRLSGLRFTDYTPDTAGPFAQTSLKILRDMLEGRQVVIYQTPKKDWGRTNRLGHALAHLERQEDGAWIQGTLVGLGLAQVKTSQRNPEMAAQLYALESYARNEKIGLWAESEQILTPATTPQHINSFQIVEGLVQSAAMKKNRIYLNFGKNWRDDFTVSIASQDRRFFSKAGINPLDWNGKIVRVRGWVQDYNGAYIEIDHPEALETIDTKPPADKRAE